MKSKHTKGIWKPLHVSGVCMGVGSEVATGYSQVIANSILPDNDEQYKEEKEEIEANMQLIAAAPELLEALKNIVKSATSDWNSKDAASMPDYIEQGAKAIKKATE